MKKIFYAIVALFIFSVITSATREPFDGDGINFFEGTWQEAIKKSGDEHKLIFLDMSTSWCGWVQKDEANYFYR